MSDQVQNALPEQAVTRDQADHFINKILVPMLRQWRVAFNSAFGPINNINASGTVSGENSTFFVDATDGPVSITLPPASQWKMRLTFKKVDSSSNLVSFTVAGDDTMPEAPATTTQYEYYTIASDEDSTWYVVANG